MESGDGAARFPWDIDLFFVFVLVSFFFCPS